MIGNIAKRLWQGAAGDGIRNQVSLPNSLSNFESWADGYGGGAGLPLPTEQTAMTLSAIYASINLIAGAIQALPLHVYRTVDGERERAESDDLWWLLNEQMTPRWSATAGWEFLILSLLLHGDAFAIIQRSRDGRITGFEPVHPFRVNVLPTTDSQRLVYAIESDPLGATRGQRQTFDQDDIIHIPGFGFNGLRGLSPLRFALRMTGSVALATQDYAGRYFANGARPDFYMEAGDEPAPEVLERIREQWADRYRGTSNAHKPAILTGGMTLKALTLPAEDVQLLETRKFQIEEIARIYGIPPFMIGHTEKSSSWGTGVEQMGIGFVKYALRQHLSKIEKEINRKCFRRAPKFVEFATEALERGDLQSQSTAFRMAIGRAGEPGWMTVNEIRRLQNRKPVAGGDTINPGTGKAAADTPADPPGGANAP